MQLLHRVLKLLILSHIGLQSIPARGYRIDPTVCGSLGFLLLPVIREDPTPFLQGFQPRLEYFSTGRNSNIPSIGGTAFIMRYRRATFIPIRMLLVSEGFLAKPNSKRCVHDGDATA